MFWEVFVRRALHFFVILALFVTYQWSKIHAIVHLKYDSYHCNLCKASQNTHQASSPIHFVLVDENILQNQHIQQRVVYQKPHRAVQKPAYRRLDFDGLNRFEVVPIPLGYDSTAPPRFS
ncbi:MAG: hypothetical protein KU28_06415 [Sulfurovum sp. PC08-66]|nr:MAG: hypothetical protein KU28_06415 [Sulfurovum sp. PC08-66]